MKLRTIFKTVILFCTIWFCAVVYATLSKIDWDAKCDWSSVGKCGEHDNCLVISNLTSGIESHRICSPEGKTIKEVRIFRTYAKTQQNVGSKIIRLEKKERKPIRVGEVIKDGKVSNQSKIGNKVMNLEVK